MRCSPAYSYQKLYTHTGTLNMETFRRRRGNIFQLLGRHLKCSFVSLGPCTFLISRMAFQNVQLHTVQFPVTSRFSFRLSETLRLPRLRDSRDSRDSQDSRDSRDSETPNNLREHDVTLWRKTVNCRDMLPVLVLPLV